MDINDIEQIEQDSQEQNGSEIQSDFEQESQYLFYENQDIKILDLQLPQINLKPPQKEYLHDSSIHQIQELYSSQETFIPQREDKSLFNFNSYDHQKGRHYVNRTIPTQYIVDEIMIKKISFGIYFQQQKSDHEKVFYQDSSTKILNGVLRIRIQPGLGGVIQILYKNPYPVGSGELYTKQMKVQIKVSNLQKIIRFKDKEMLCFVYSGFPEFYVNNIIDSRREKKGVVITDIVNTSKKWERVENQSTVNICRLDALTKYFMKDQGTIALHDVQRLIIPQVVSSIAKIKDIPVFDNINFNKLLIEPFEKLQKKYSCWLKQQLRQVENVSPRSAFQISFSLLSLLYYCENINLGQLSETIGCIVRLVQKSESSNKLHTIRIICETCLKIKKSDTILKKSTSLSNIFKNKMAKILSGQIEEQKDICLIKSAKLTPSGLIPSGYSIDIRNKLTRQFIGHQSQFIKIQVVNDDLIGSKLFKCGKITSEFFWKHFAKLSIQGHDFIPLSWTQSQLKNSSMWFTQVKKSKNDQNIIDREEIIRFLGDFKKIKNPSLKAARMGQNLSTGQSINLKNVKIRYIKDDKVGQYLYTDGIGKISADLVKKIQAQLLISATVFQIRFLGCKGVVALNHLLPDNTIQMRESMKKFECSHPDAIKYFDVLDFNTFRPSFINKQILILLEANGVNRESMKAVQDEYLKKLFLEGLDFQSRLKKDEGSNFLINSLKQRSLNILEKPERKIDHFSDVLNQFGSTMQLNIGIQPTFRGILIQKYYSKLKDLVKKSHIKVDKSARILGIIDEFNILEENEVYCTILKDQTQKKMNSKRYRKKIKLILKKIKELQKENGGKDVKTNAQFQPNKSCNLTENQIILLKRYKERSKKFIRQNISGRVMVTRNPCMHPADIRVLQCVSSQQASQRFQQKYGRQNLFQDLPNCVIFPKEGKIPITSQISGSDLDGDTFFITWDERLIPERSFKPFITDSQKKYIRQYDEEGDQDEQIMNFFFQFIFNNNLGRLANAHLSFADRQGAFNEKCIKLCKLHNMAVDYPKKGYKFEYNQKQLLIQQYPHYMEKEQSKKSYESISIIGKLYNQAKSYYQQFRQKSNQIKKYKFSFILPFLKLKPEYGQKQIANACDVVKQFNDQMRSLMQIYGVEREFQIYIMKISQNQKNSRERVKFIEQLRVKYFQKFFKSLEIPCDPYSYVQRVKKNTVQIDTKVIRKLILWYLVSHIQIIEEGDYNKKGVDVILNIKKRLDGFKVNCIGICWFSLPFITYQTLRILKQYYQKIKK